MYPRFDYVKSLVETLFWTSSWTVYVEVLSVFLFMFLRMFFVFCDVRTGVFTMDSYLTLRDDFGHAPEWELIHKGSKLY